jgi:DNA invertase Pin-like site-specific DNA recombinase
VSVQDNFDLATEQGRLCLRIMLAFAQFERERTASAWDDARRRAVMHGIHASSRPPVGYLQGPDGRLRPHPRHAKLVRQAFELRAASRTLDAAGQFLRHHHVRSVHGGDACGTARR